MKMKTILLVATVLILAGTTTSCRKDYTCKCSKTYTTGSGSSTADYATYTYKENRRRAEERCNANAATGYDLFGDYSINCAIQ